MAPIIRCTICDGIARDIVVGVTARTTTTTTTPNHHHTTTTTQVRTGAFPFCVSTSVQTHEGGSVAALAHTALKFASVELALGLHGDPRAGQDAERHCHCSHRNGVRTLPPAQCGISILGRGCGAVRALVTTPWPPLVSGSHTSPWCLELLLNFTPFLREGRRLTPVRESMLDHGVPCRSRQVSSRMGPHTVSRVSSRLCVSSPCRSPSLQFSPILQRTTVRSATHTDSGLNGELMDNVFVFGHEELHLCRGEQLVHCFRWHCSSSVASSWPRWASSVFFQGRRGSCPQGHGPHNESRACSDLDKTRRCSSHVRTTTTTTTTSTTTNNRRVVVDSF